MATYLTREVWEVVPYYQVSHGPESFHKLVGEAWNTRIKYNLSGPRELMQLVLLQQNAQERKDMRDWFDSNKGSFGEFWMRSHKMDYEVSEIASIGAGAFKVINHETRFGLFGLTRHVIVKRTGECYKITGYSEADAGANTTLNISPSLVSALEVGDEIQNLFLMRFGDDTLEFAQSNLGPNITETSVRLVEIQEDTP